MGRERSHWRREEADHWLFFAWTLCSGERFRAEEQPNFALNGNNSITKHDKQFFSAATVSEKCTQYNSGANVQLFSTTCNRITCECQNYSNKFFSFHRKQINGSYSFAYKVNLNFIWMVERRLCIIKVTPRSFYYTTDRLFHLWKVTTASVLRRSGNNHQRFPPMVSYEKGEVLA